MKQLYAFLRLQFPFFALATLALLLTSVPAGAQVVKAFSQRTVGNNVPGNGIYRIKGDFTMIGNTNLTLRNYSNSGTNDNEMVYVDVDGDATTLNSSSANLNFSTENGANPACSKVLFAGLYWAGRARTGNTTFSVTKGSVTKNYNKTQVSLRGPGTSAYTTVTASTSNILFPNGSNANIYVGFADVTDYVNQRGAGTYTVADLALQEGTHDATGMHGGWSLIVVYENNLMKWRDVTLFDGYTYMEGNGNNNSTSLERTAVVNINGFQAVPTGAVNVKVGLMASEGERGWRRDVLQIDDAATGTNWVSLRFDPNANTVNDFNDFFTGSIQTGGNTRNPNLVNNTGLDVLMFNLPNTNNSLIANNQTSTRFRVGTGADTYVLFNLAFSVDAYVPEVQNHLAVAGASVTTAVPGQTIEYNIDVFNRGTEAVNNYRMVVPIPAYADYDGGLTKTLNYSTPTPSPNNLYFDPTLGPKGSVVYDFGTLPLPATVIPALTASQALANFKFRLKVTDNCTVLRGSLCPPRVSVNGVSAGTGAVSGSSFSNLPFVTSQGSGACSGTPNTDPLNIAIDATSYQTCDASNFDAQNRRVFNVCPAAGSNTIAVSSIAGTFPAGTRFFASNTPGAEEFTSTFPALQGSTVYFALPAGTGACYIPLVLNVCTINQVFAGKVWIDRNGDRHQNGTEVAPATSMYRVLAIAANGPNKDKVVAQASYNNTGNFSMNLPANPVMEAGSTTAAQYNFVLARTEMAPGNGATASVPGSGMLGAAASSGGEYYVTNPADGGANAGRFSGVGIASAVTAGAPYTDVTDLNIGIQSRPMTDAVFTALPSRPVGTYWNIDNDDQVLSGIDAEDGVLEANSGRTFRILSNPTVPPTVPGGTPLVVRLAYDFNGNGPDASDIIDASADPDDNVFVNIPNYDRMRLYVFFQSGVGSYNGSFAYSAVDGANATSSAPALYSFTAVLPINGLELSGSYSAGKSNLQWTVKSIDDAEYFVLERSNTPGNFKQVHVAQLNGTRYSFTDNMHGFSGNEAYYRVKLVRKNGTVSYSNVLSLKMAAISGLQLAPTLVRTDLQVRFNNVRQQDVQIRVVNMAGQVVNVQKQNVGSGNISLNLGGFERLPNGTYTVQVFAGTSVQQGKIVVQH